MQKAEARVEDPGLAGVRLDVFIAEAMGLFSRSQARGRVVEARVNGKIVRLARKLKLGDFVSVDFSDAPPIEAIAEDIPLDVIFENDEVLVIDKPQGLVVHPGSGNPSGTLVNALLFRYDIGRSFGEGNPRPGIVHRLDKETSGLIIVAKNPAAHEFLAAQFAARRVKKRYLAVLMGCPNEPRGRVETMIVRDPSDRKKFAVSSTRGKKAVTDYIVLRRYSTASAPAYGFLSMRPRTGRTHQLRVHARLLSAPILGDRLYGKPDPLFPDATLMLHSHRLAIVLPGETSPRVFAAPLPRRFRDVLGALHKSSPR